MKRKIVVTADSVRIVAVLNTKTRPWLVRREVEKIRGVLADRLQMAVVDLPHIESRLHTVRVE